MAGHDKGPLLGRQVTGSATYDPTLLFPVPRENARQTLPGGLFSAFGEDLWHAYELSWLNASGMPQMYVGRIIVPIDSPNIIESKSLKLYLHSLNNHSFDDDETAQRVIESDLSRVALAAVRVELEAVMSPAFDPVDLSAAGGSHSRCLDDLSVTFADRPDASVLLAQAGDMRVHTHLMRSLCPVTAQPDWATVIVESRGRACAPAAILAYLLAYRNHQEFHEQCVERIYHDLWAHLAPSYLSVQALYTRRGGLDICPWRCSHAEPAPHRRINRQ